MWRARPGGGRAVLLEGVDWRVGEGERWAVIGPNGAGKTTLLAIAGAVAHPSEGSASVLGRPLGGTDLRDLRGAIGHVDAAMAGRFRPRASALEVVLTGATATIAPLPGRLAEADGDRAAALLGQMGCAGLLGRAFGRLSRGEQQRVLLARALMPRPRMLLLDEPTAGSTSPAASSSCRTSTTSCGPIRR